MKIIFFLFLLVVAAWIGMFINQNPGVLLLSLQGWCVEMPIWLAATLLLTTIWLLLIGNNLLNWLSYSYSKIQKKRSQQYSDQAILQLAQSKWSLAEKYATKGVINNDSPFMNYITAAKAAQEQQAWKRRDHYLMLASNVSKEGRLSAGIIKAKLQYKQGETQKSLNTLCSLQLQAPKHPLVLQLLANIYAENNNWHDLFTLLPKLKKYRCADPNTQQTLTDKAYQGLLLETTQQHGKQELLRFWKNIPKKDKFRIPILETYVSCLYRLELHDEAVILLNSVLKKIWDHKLVRLYGFLQPPNVNKQIYMAESWLKQHHRDPTLLLSLARLCLRQQLWGKARDYLEMSLQLEENPETYAELGRLLVTIGEEAKGQEYYRKGLLTLTEILPLEQKK